MKKLTVIDLFSGAGGVSEGFLQANLFEFVAHVEWEKPMVNTLRENLIKRWGYSEQEAKKRVIRFDIQKTHELMNGSWSQDTIELYGDDIWAINPKLFEEIGCIHTCQGMEFDYVGVIIGKDLIFKDDKVTTNKLAISKDDKTSKIKGCKNESLADRLIKNTYKVLLTRGQKGCYIYCEDKSLSEYIKERIS